MAVTMGFVLRVDSYPTAVAIPPLQQGMSPVPPIIEAQRIVETTATAPNNSSRNHLRQHSETAVSSNARALTYSAKGIARGVSQIGDGRLLNIYA